jgi:hypothetical protein
LPALVQGWDETGVVYLNDSYLAALFGIREDTGKLYVKSPLDREKVERVEVTLMVEDLKAVDPKLQNNTGQ